MKSRRYQVEISAAQVSDERRTLEVCLTVRGDPSNLKREGQVLAWLRFELRDSLYCRNQLHDRLYVPFSIPWPAEPESLDAKKLLGLRGTVRVARGKVVYRT